MFSRKLLLLAGASLLSGLPVQAFAQTDDIGIEILQLLVDEGILPASKAQDLLNRAKQQAELRREREAPRTASTIDVPYVPETVRDQIKAEVKQEMIAEAKTEGWIAEDRMPDWIKRITISGDFRLRHESDLYADGNFDQFPNVAAINAQGGVPSIDFPLLNSTVDRHRIRYRARLGIDAKLNDSVSVGFRLASGADNGPVSTNTTFGNYFQKNNVYIDRAFVKISPLRYVDLVGGRMPNPFISTDLIWDEDLNPEGVSGTAHYSFGSNMMDLSLFATGAAFPMVEREDDRADRWILAGQGGVSFKPASNVAVSLAGAYYDFTNVQGKKDAPASRENDYTAPPLLGIGNSIFNIRNDGLTSLAGLASKFELMNILGSVAYTGFGPIQVKLTGDYVKNLGFDRNEIARLRQGEPSAVQGGDTAFLVRLDVGYPQIEKFGDWRVSAAYRRVETDAVLDVFTDSDFAFGSTDVEGYILKGQLGIYKNTAVGLSWFSSRSIERPPFDVDILHLDLLTKF